MKTVTAEHELDKMFDVTPGKTEILVPDGAPVPTEIIDVEEVEEVESQLIDMTPETPQDLYDSKDIEIETQINDVHTKAIEAYETMIVASQTVLDKKHAPRSAEVAAQFLQIALNASKEKNQIKDRKDKIIAMRRQPGHSPTTVNHNTQNNIVTDRETARKLLKERNENNE